MNADRLLALYERVAEAPDAIARLRRFVLDLAVRGKLVAQDACDEPASELLKRIAAEKARLVKAGEIRKPKALPPVDDEPFDLPSNWRWVRIRDVTSDRGQRIPDGDFTYIDVTAINKEAGIVAEPKVLTKDEAPSRARKIAAKGDVLYSCVRPYLLNVAVLSQDFDPAPIASTAFAVLNGHGLVLPTYLWIALRSPFMVECVEENQRGQAYPAINDADFAVLPFPLPPISEQWRIMAKVEELMALLDRLEAARTAREATRDRLTASSLTRLTASDADPKDFPDNARFALATLPALTTRPDQIKPLRQTILNLAVRGKLVEQDPKDEPAAELLKRIAAIKADLIKAGLAKREKPSDRDAFPYELPLAWSWCTLSHLSKLITKGSSPKWQGISYVNAEDGLLFITSENVGNFTLRKLEELKYVETRFREMEPRSMLQKSDILINLVGASIGRTALYNLDEEANINQAVSLVRLVDPAIGPSVDYLLMYLNSDEAVEMMLGSRVVTAQPNISLADVSSFPIPLPPLAEQHRIVAKVDALMALCDRLEGVLRALDTTRAPLLEALLHEALAPVVPTMAAAE